VIPETHSLRPGCPGCAAPAANPFYAVAATPVTCTSIFDTAAEARAVPMGRVELSACVRCGLIWNPCFDAAKAEIGARYESSQAASAHFGQFARGLSRAWVERHGLRGKRVLEIGCGRGEFLGLMLADGIGAALGIDPLAPTEAPADARLRFHVGRFDRTTLDLEADAVVCRHTLEHIAPVQEFLGLLADWARRAPQRVVLFEVPATERLLSERAFWDVYYEHCNYFTAASLAHAFEAAGFEVLSHERAYGEQYLLLEARLRVDGAPALSGGFAGFAAECAEFGSAARSAVARCDAGLAQLAAAGRPVVLWQGAAKTVGFLAALQAPGRVQGAVDLSPQRHGRFLPGTALQVHAPDALREIDPRYVVLMNPVYVEEVRAHLAALGVGATLLTVNDLCEGRAPAETH